MKGWQFATNGEKRRGPPAQLPRHRTQNRRSTAKHMAIGNQHPNSSHALSVSTGETITVERSFPMKSWEVASLHSGPAVQTDPQPIVRTGSVTITGSRDVDRRTARHLFEQHLSSLLHQGRTWLVAGARGIDQWAIEWLGEQSESCWAVVPYTLRDQPGSVQSSLEQIERVIELQLPRRKSAGAFRNRYMVDLSQIVFGFWSGKGGGTIKTLRHALRKGKEVHGIPVSTADSPT